MSESEARQYAFLLRNVMRNDFRYGYRQEDLWALASTKAIETYQVQDVAPWVYTPVWNKGKCFICIYQVLMQPQQFPNHIARIAKADTQYPLIITDDIFNPYGTILDGNHRFAKIILQQKETVHVVKLSQADLISIRQDLSSNLRE